jgi:hypothetical protein
MHPRHDISLMSTFPFLLENALGAFYHVAVNLEPLSLVLLFVDFLLHKHEVVGINLRSGTGFLVL